MFNSLLNSTLNKFFITITTSLVIISLMQWQEEKTINSYWIILLILSLLPMLKIPGKRSLIAKYHTRTLMKHYERERCNTATIGLSVTTQQGEEEKLFNTDVFSSCKQYTDQYGLKTSQLRYEFKRADLADPWKLSVYYTFPLLENYSQFMIREANEPVSKTLTAQMQRLRNKLKDIGYGSKFLTTAFAPYQDSVNFFIVTRKNSSIENLRHYPDARVISIIICDSMPPKTIIGLNPSHRRVKKNNTTSNKTCSVREKMKRSYISPQHYS